jgi:pimeloyl-ACP methyl ester carboxylesterase
MTSTPTAASARPPRRWLLRGVATFAGAALIAYALIALYMFAMQRSFLYVPDIRDVAGEVSRLPGAEAITLTTPDGETLNAWWKPPADETRPVYLYLHGNGANLTRRVGRFQRLTEDGSGLLAVSWRGYGGSTGSPTEAGLIADSRAAHDWISQRVAANRLILFGESLGTGLAVRLAAERQAALLVLDSPYASIVALGARRFPWLPVRLLMQDQFRTDELAPLVRIPVVAQHCRTDWIIPLDEAERLMAAFPSRPRFTVIEGRCHVPDVTRVLLPKTREAFAGLAR